MRVVPLARQAAQLVRRHWPLIVLTTGGVLLRLLATLSFRPALMFYVDSYEYARDAGRWAPPVSHPLGYGLLLRTVSWTGRLAAVPIEQHLVGLALGVAVYWFTYRAGVGRIWAGVAAAPLLLDAWTIALEQFVLSDFLFTAILLVATGLLLTQHRPSVLRCVAVGAVVGFAVWVRVVGVTVLPLFVLTPILCRWGWRRAGALAVTAGIVTGGYALWFASAHGSLGLTKAGDRLLYGRLATFADCGDMDVPVDERGLCPDPRRRLSALDYTWSKSSPYYAWQRHGGSTARLHNFNRRVMLQQPLGWVRSTLVSLGGYLDPSTVVPASRHLNSWKLLATRRGADGNVWNAPPTFARAADQIGKGPPVRPRRADAGRLAAILQRYQAIEHLPGPLLAASVLAAIAVLSLPNRRRRLPRRLVLLPVATGIVLLVAAAATSAFDYRYLFPSVVLAWPAAAVAGWQLSHIAPRRR